MGFTDEDSALLEDFMRLCQHKLLHLTDHKIEDGLKPSSATGIQDSDTMRPPRPGCVYLTCHGSKSSTEGRYLLVIDADQLDPALFRVDEDHFLNFDLWNTSGPRYEPSDNLPALIELYMKNKQSYYDQETPYNPEWFNTVSEMLDTPTQILRSLAARSCAYAGEIPQEAITECIDTLVEPQMQTEYFNSQFFRDTSEQLHKKYGW